MWKPTTGPQPTPLRTRTGRYFSTRHRGLDMVALGGTMVGTNWDSYGSGLGMSIFLPRPTSQREELETIASFFGISRTGDAMEHLTGAPSSVLSRITHDDESPKHQRHISIVAAFCRELQIALVDISGRDGPRSGSMQGWLHSGAVQTTHHGVLTPWEALGNEDLAREALDHLRNIVG